MAFAKSNSLTLGNTVLSDAAYRAKPEYNLFDRLLLNRLNDPRDLPIAHFMIEATLVVIPIVICLYLFAAPWWLAAVYVPFNVFVYMDRYILVLHNTSHRPLFQKRWSWLNRYVVWVLGPLFGETPETYFAHHIGMHHIEENLEGDLSSTMPYQRDSFWGWLRYFLQFFFGVIAQLLSYLSIKRRARLRKRIIAGELSFLIVVVALFYVNPTITCFVFIAPWLVCRFSMMAGNWAQHAFIDRSHPGDPYASSITLINCRYNRRCFNDGYHIGHHLKARMHWTELPGELVKNREIYRAHDAIIFEGIDFLAVWALLMCKRYKTLARHFVDLQSPPRPSEQVIALLKQRVQPIRLGTT